MARNQQDILVKIKVLLEGLGNVRALAGHIKELNGGGGRGGQAVALAGDLDKLSTAVDRLATAQEKASSKGGFVRFLVGVSAVVNTLGGIPQALTGLEKLLDFLDHVGGGLGKVVGKVKEFGSSVFSSLSQFASGAGAQAGAALSSLGGAASGIGAALGAALPFIAAAAAGLVVLLAAVTPLVVAFTGLAAAVGIGLAALFKIGPAGIELNSQLEQAKLGIAAVVASIAQIKIDGKPLEGAEKLAAAMVLADEQVNKLRVDAINTTATFEEILPAFQEALAPGLAAGLTMDEVRRVTVQVVQAAGALNIPLHQVNQEIRSILEGNIDINARLAKSLDISAADIKLWKQKGTLAEELNKKLGGFTVAGIKAAQTLEGLKSNLQEALNVFNQEATTRAFEALKDEFVRLLPQLFDFKNSAIAAQFQVLAQLADDVLVRVIRIGGSIAQGVVNGLKRAADFVSQNKATISNILNLVELIVRQILRGAGVLARVATDTGSWGSLLTVVQGTLAAINVLLAVMVDRLREAEPLLRLAALAGAAFLAMNPGLAAAARAGTAAGGGGGAEPETGFSSVRLNPDGSLKQSVTLSTLPRVGGGGKKGGGGGRHSQVRELTRALGEADIAQRLAEAQAKFAAIRQEVEASVAAIQNGLDDAITSISEAYRLEAALADKALAAEKDRIAAELQAAKDKRNLAVKNLDPKLTGAEKRLAIAAEDKKLLTETTQLEAERARLVSETADKKAELVRNEALAQKALADSVTDIENQLDALSRSSSVRADAAAREIEARFEETRRQLIANFGEASAQVKALDRLIAQLSERAKFQELTANVGVKFSELRDLIELLSVGVESGQIKARDATKRRVELEREYKRVLLDEINGLAEIARRTGDPALLAAVRQLQIEWAKLGNVIDETAKRIDDTLRRGLEDTLANIITRTETVGEAFRKLAQSILAEIARILAANFVEKLFGGVLNTGSGNSIGNILAKILGGNTTKTSGSAPRPGSGIENIPLIIRNFQSGTISNLTGIKGNTFAALGELRGGFAATGAKLNELISFLPNLLPVGGSLLRDLVVKGIEFAGAVALKKIPQKTGRSRDYATGGFESAAPGGRLIRVAEAGFDEVILTTDPRHGGRTARLLGEFLRRTGLAPDFGSVVLEGALAGVPSFAAGGFALEGINPPEMIGGDTYHVTTQATIQTTTPQAFKGSEASIERDLSRMTLRGIRRAKSQPGK
jgi:hypothetical protein